MEVVEQHIGRALGNGHNPASSGESPSEATSEMALASLRSILDVQDFSLAAKIITALGASPPYLGLVAALNHATQCLSNLCEREKFSKLHQFRDATARIAEQLFQHKDLPPHFTMVPDFRSLNSPFRLFVERGSRYSRTIDSQISAIKALAFTDSIARGMAIPDSFASRLLTLQRSAAKGGESSKHWQQLAADLPFDQEHARSLFDQTKFDSVREFLRELTPLLDGRVPDLAPRASACNSPERNSASAISEVVLQEQDGGSEEGCVDPEEDDVGSHGNVTSEGLVAWLNKRSANAYRLAACGFRYGWDHLHPDELRQATKKLASILANPSSDTRELACLALVSMASCLPPKLALEIPLTMNDDLWLDVGVGVLHWNLNRVVQRDAPDPALLASSYYPASMIRLPLPISAVSILNRLKQSSRGASKLNELLFPAVSDKADLLRQYEHFLKLGDSSSHSPRPSRFAYSFGRCVLAQTGQDVVAALASIDLALAAPGQMHYFCLSESVLFDALDETYTFLGLGKTTRPETCGYIGSPLRPRDDVVAEGWRKVLEEIGRLRSLITPRMAISDFMNVFNQLSSHHLAAITFLTGHRGTRLERLTYPLLFSSREFLTISDKESTEYSAYRVLPRFPSLDSILESHLSLLCSLATRLERHDRKLAKRLAAISTGKRKNCPLFFCILENGKTWELRPTRTSTLAGYFVTHFGAVRNFGRHFWLSKLIESDASRMLLRFFLGHARRGMEPHGAASGISLRSACETISPILAAIASDFRFPSPLPGSPATYRPSRVPFQFRRVLAKTRNDFVADYIACVDVPGHVASAIAEPCPFNTMTLAGHAAITFLRAHFIEETTPLAPWPRFLIALVVFDGVCNPRLMEAVWRSVPDKVLRLGHTPIVECVLPTGVRPILLQPPTATCLNQVVGSSTIPFEQARREIGTWAKVVSGFPFANSEDALAFLGSLMECWMRIELSPWLVTASSLEFSAACISMKSIARLAHGRPAVLNADQPDPPLAGRAARSSMHREIGDLAKIANDIADTAKKYGENRKRLRLLYEALVAHLRGSALSPLATDVATWLIHEATAEKPMEAASIASYLSKLRDGFQELDQELHFEDLDPDDWLALTKYIEDGHVGEQLKQRRSILRRFAGFWRDRGSAVPGSIFVSTDGAAAVITHASAVYVSGRDVDRMAVFIADQLESQPLMHEKAMVKISLCAYAPFRSGEISRVRSVDISNHLPAVFITSSGFSHLKNQRHSRGSVELGRIQQQQLLSLRNEISQLSSQRDGYLWLLDDPECRFADVTKIDHVLGRALRLTTGEPNARIHSLRGSAVARMVTPLVDGLLAALADGSCLALPAPCVNEEEWLKISIAARQARHTKSLTTIRYYCATWPLQLFLELSKTLECVPIDDSYANIIDGLKSDALRQALSRTRRNFPNAPLAEWQMLAKRLSRITTIRSAEILLMKTETTPELAPRRSPDAATDSQCIHYLLLRMAGLELEVAINESRVQTSHIPTLEELCRQPAGRTSGVVKSSASKGMEGDKRDWQRRLASAPGQQLISAAARCYDISILAAAIQLLNTEAKSDIHEDVLLRVIRTLRDVVPKDFTFNVLPSLTRSSPLLQRKIRAIDPDASTKRSSKRLGVGYTLTLTTVASEKRGPQPDGKATRIFRQALHARLALLTTQPTGGKENV